MRPLYDFIVHVPKLFGDTLEVAGIELFKDTRWDDFKGRVSYGTIKAIPAKADLPESVKVGDTLVFHHHVNQQPEKYGIGEDHYLVAWHPTEINGQAYMVIHEDDSVTVLGDWVILEATEDKKVDVVSAGGLFLGTELVEAKQEAAVLHPSAGTEELGLEVGDVVMYGKSADYRITLPDGSQVFRMKPAYILAAYV
jgi:co-chaperonin GroES (HSP10)